MVCYKVIFDQVEQIFPLSMGSKRAMYLIANTRLRDTQIPAESAQQRYN